MKTKTRKTATLSDLASWKPCWGAEQVEEFVSGRRKRWNWAQVVELRGAEGLPDADWMWVAMQFLLHCGQERALRLFACDCASRALHRERKAGREPDARSWAAVEVSHKYAMGQATGTELRDAYADADASADASAADAAYDAAYASAASAAASAAAYADASAADASAAYASAYAASAAAYAADAADASAARLEERAQQCERLVSIAAGEWVS